MVVWQVRRIRDRLSVSMPPSPPSVCAAPPSPPPPPVAAPLAANSLVNSLALPETMNPQLFLNRLKALRAPKEENAKKFVRVEDDPSLNKKERLARVFRALHNAIVDAKGVYHPLKLK